MELIIIYGSEAVGKLTIARQLAEKTGFSLFHNHVSVDVARTLFDFGEEGFNETVWAVRELVFEQAARYEMPGLIFTWAYSHPDFKPYLDRIKAIMTRYNGVIHYVYITCSEEALSRRVTNADRKAAGKIHTVDALERQRTKKNHVVIPDTDSLVIDNTDLSPQEAAHRIITHFRL